MNTALVIMAAGIGSRFGGGVKQLEPVGPNGELIIDYSIHDALEAGFTKIVFIIRKDIEKDFREIIGDRIEKVCAVRGVEVVYTFQSLDAVPAGVAVPADRKKPWGTGQAVLTCKGAVTEPFMVINADDYYGRSAYKTVHDYLVENYSPERPNDFCMAGFILKNTLSDNGAVTRGICRANEDGYLTDVVETSGIVKTADGAMSGDTVLDPESYVSMNMWGLTPEFIDLLEDGFVEFFAKQEGEIKGEYLLPIYIGELLRKGKVQVKVLESRDKWFGVTYREDKPLVVESFKKLIAEGVIPEKLF